MKFNKTFFYGTNSSDKKTHLKYVSPIIEKSSIELDIYEDLERGTKKCNIDFRAHKSNGKIKGSYLMRIFKDEKNILSLKYMDRNGYYSNDFSGFLIEFYPDIYMKIENGILTIDMLKDIIEKTISIINVRAIEKGDPFISRKINLDIEDFTNLENNNIDFVQNSKTSKVKTINKKITR